MIKRPASKVDISIIKLILALNFLCHFIIAGNIVRFFSGKEFCLRRLEIFTPWPFTEKRLLFHLFSDYILSDKECAKFSEQYFLFA